MRSARDVAAGDVRVAMLDVARVHDDAREHAPTEARREALELRLDAVGHVHGRAVRNMAVRPERLFPGRRATGIEETLLRHQHEGPLGMLAAPQGGLRRGDV